VASGAEAGALTWPAIGGRKSRRSRGAVSARRLRIRGEKMLRRTRSVYFKGSGCCCCFCFLLLLLAAAAALLIDQCLDVENRSAHAPKRRRCESVPPPRAGEREMLLPNPPPPPNPTMDSLCVMCACAAGDKDMPPPPPLRGCSLG
jgi:hypothetical protein